MTDYKQQIRGPFEVKLTPQNDGSGVGDPAISRMAIDKHFSGELSAASLGQMLSFRSELPGSAGYVAMELVRGMLGGREGSFVLQHSGTMQRGEASLDLHVVPDSGTGELMGLSGVMRIIIEEGQHFYEFDYSLPEAG
ncbi:DUF3224 domain-containing protein [bacterium]|nr:DUF3224 domain-containing protein [bacterium]